MCGVRLTSSNSCKKKNKKSGRFTLHYCIVNGRNVSANKQSVFRIVLYIIGNDGWDSSYMYILCNLRIHFFWGDVKETNNLTN